MAADPVLKKTDIAASEGNLLPHILSLHLSLVSYMRGTKMQMREMRRYLRQMMLT